jgi:hypothetical protein
MKNKGQRKPKGQSKMDNPEKSTTQGTQELQSEKSRTGYNELLRLIERICQVNVA